MRNESLLFLRAIVMGIWLLVSYRGVRFLYRAVVSDKRKNGRILDLLYWVVAGGVVFSEIYRYNSGQLRIFMLPGAVFGAFFSNYLLNRLLFLIKRCKLLPRKPTRKRFKSFKRSRRFETVKKKK
ncbi:spore cortex biosynthesis protein YabQ [Blautia sp. MSJ-19]|uniref:spore cortex biosynthesis protein YabQ n=1 Tax=Blautia sp. MSJ-19 TaxID=2841517 RepID=UPI001C0EEC00